MNATSRRFRFGLWGITVFYWIGILVLTHLPPSELPKTHISDKIEHILAYGVLAGLLYASLTVLGRRSPLIIAGLVFLVALAYGAFDELTQPYFGRTCDIRDWCADATGAAIVLVLMTILQWCF